MKTRFEQKCEEYKKELEAFLIENQITITDYCKELNDSFIIDVLFPKTEGELKNAITSFNMYKTIYNEVNCNNNDLDDNTAYLINVMAIEGLDEEKSSMYSEIEEAMYAVVTDEKARTRFQLDSLKLENSDKASSALIELIASKSSNPFQAKLLFETYTNNLLLAETKSIKRALKDNPCGMTGRILLTSFQESITGLKGYIINNKRIYEYIIATSEPQMKRKIEKSSKK